MFLHSTECHPHSTPALPTGPAPALPSDHFSSFHQIWGRCGLTAVSQRIALVCPPLFFCHWPCDFFTACFTAYPGTLFGHPHRGAYPPHPLPSGDRLAALCRLPLYPTPCWEVWPSAVWLGVLPFVTKNPRGIRGFRFSIKLFAKLYFNE